MTRRASRELSEWCRRELGSPVGRVLFAAGFASRVCGPPLQDGREVVAKLRSFTPRLLGAALVQRHLWAAGFPCPQPLAGPYVHKEVVTPELAEQYTRFTGRRARGGR